MQNDQYRREFMKRKGSNTYTIVYTVFFVGLVMLQSSASAQQGSKNTPVIVTNTNANPVPVTGSVTTASRPTVQLLNAINAEVLAGEQRVWKIDVRNFSKIRVCTIPREGGSFPVYITDLPLASDGQSFGDGVFLAAAGGENLALYNFCQILDVLPNSDIYLTVQNTSEVTARGNVKVWGQ
jgi:hypothetical protein